MDTVTEPDDEHRRMARELHDRGVRFVMAGWIDVLGRQRAKTVPVGHLPGLLAGSERYTPRGMGGIGRMDPVEAEGVAIPDLATLCVLPWDPTVAWMTADLYSERGDPFALCPRAALRRQVAVAADMGFVCQLGVESEFYVYRPEQLGPDATAMVPMAPSGRIRPSQAYDLEATLDAMPFLGRMAAYLEELDFGLFSFDAEGGDGQYEFDFAHAEVLRSADRLTLFRLTAKQAAKECGLAATFMPKPFAEAWGSGAHFNMSLEDMAGNNLFRTPDGQWSKETYQFVAGVLAHAPALTALANPTTNSYRRLVDTLTDGEVSWAPTRVSFGYNNRSCMLRLPGNRPAVENRAVDSAANTHLTAAFMLAAGLDGIRRELDPGSPHDEPASAGTVTRLPRTLLESVEAFTADPLVAEVFAPGFVRDYVEMKTVEWEASHREVTASERERYLQNL